MSFLGEGVLECLESAEFHKRKSILDSGKEEVKRRKDDSRTSFSRTLRASSSSAWVACCLSRRFVS